jgi:hypothetical protein
MGYEMFGPETALLALALFTFEPTVLAHGALVTTDRGWLRVHAPQCMHSTGT